MKALIPNPINETQRVFNELCEKGGGVRGGPPRTKVLELLMTSGQSLNKLAFHETQEHMDALPEANPWHICFAIGLSWGHLAKLEFDFTESVVNVLSNWNAADLKIAKSFHLERGPDPIEQSLSGAYILFSKVILPKELPTTLIQLGRAQDRWLSPILNPTTRPPYIGAWNATAMFMVALFAQPALCASQVTPTPMLPPGGPISGGLGLLHKAGLVSCPPAGSILDDHTFEPGAIYENNKLVTELCKQKSGWSLVDVHSGVYMLGTRDPHSANWI